MSKKHSFEKIKAHFEREGCTLLATDYKNNKTLMPYICKCGNESKIRYNDFKNGKRCMECRIADRRHSLEEVKAHFEREGCKLLATEYKNDKTLMPYICKCGNESKIRYNHFQSGKRCNNCKKSKGEKLIRKYLLENNINFKQEFKLNKCRYKQKLRFDFLVRLDILNGFLTEINGYQHYFYSSFGSKVLHAAKRKLMNSIRNDYIKLQYVFKYKIPYLIIPYWDLHRAKEIMDDVRSGRMPTFSEPPKIVKKYADIRRKIRNHLGITEPEVLCGFFNRSYLKITDPILVVHS